MFLRQVQTAPMSSDRSTITDSAFYDSCRRLTTRRFGRERGTGPRRTIKLALDINVSAQNRAGSARDTCSGRSWVPSEGLSEMRANVIHLPCSPEVADKQALGAGQARFIA